MKDDLILSIKGTEDSVTVQSYFNSDYYKVESYEFSDGTVWKVADITDKARVYYGTTEKTLIGFESGSGYNINEIFYAGDVGVTVNGGDGTDTLVSGKGNDTLSGGKGNDTYIFNLGDGKDVINDYEGSAAGRSDKLIFGEGIKPEDVSVKRVKDDLILSIKGTEDSVTVQSFFNSDYYKVESYEFADGTVWKTSDIAEKARVYVGTDETTLTGFESGSGYSINEIFYASDVGVTINAGNGNDEIYGGAGADIINAGSEDDKIYGGKGNDTLNGGKGNDTYVFNLGDGQDVINDYEGSAAGRSDKLIFGEGIKTEDVSVKRVNNDLILSIKGTEDSVTVQSYFSSDYYKVESYEFADGTVWKTADITDKARTYYGTTEKTLTGFESGSGYNINEIFYAGDVGVTVNGGDGTDTLVSGKGNDTLNGGKGNDTYVFNLGDGQDVIYDYEGSAAGRSDKAVFDDITASNLLFSKSGNDLVIKYGESDSVTVTNHFYSDYYKIENFHSADGYTLSHTNINQLIQAMATFEADSGMTWADAAAQNNEDLNSIVQNIWVYVG